MSSFFRFVEKHGMIEILREPSQSNLILLLFLGIISTYIFLYNHDSRRFIYFFRSFYNKQYQINYGRINRVFEPFNVLLSVSSVFSASFLLSLYLEYGSRPSYFGFLFMDSLAIIMSYLVAKWGAIYLTCHLFKKKLFFSEYSLFSLQYANLFFTPLVAAMIYIYLIDFYTLNTLSVLLSIALLLLIVSRLKTLFRIPVRTSLGFFHIILYICIFEIAPFLWLLNGLNC